VFGYIIAEPESLHRHASRYLAAINKRDKERAEHKLAVKRLLSNRALSAAGVHPLLAPATFEVAPIWAITSFISFVKRGMHSMIAQHHLESFEIQLREVIKPDQFADDSEYGAAIFDRAELVVDVYDGLAQVDTKLPKIEE